MEIKKIEQINKLLLEQYNKMNDQFKVTNEADISKQLAPKANLLPKPKSVEIDITLKEEVPLYDKNGNMIKTKINPEIPNESLAIISSNQQDKVSNEGRTGKAEYFSAIHNLTRNVFVIGEQNASRKNIKKDKFKVFGLYGVVLVVLILLYFLLIN